MYKKRLGDFFLASFFLAEASTPFYNVRGVLKEVSFFSYQFIESYISVLQKAFYE